LGCPIWASERWKGTLFTTRALRQDWLRQYSQVFNTVEGNSTFYGLPKRETVERWAEDTGAGFRFALKFPRAISHERRLVEAEDETRQFLEVLAVLAKADRLGPSFLQLPPNFARSEWPALERYLRQLPGEFSYAVEVRHRDFFDAGKLESRLDALLRELEIDRVLLDSRPLFSADPEDDAEAGAQQQKPQSPHRTTVTGRRPLVRLIGRNDIDAMTPWLTEWAGLVARWIEDGLTPYFFTHTPDDTFAPHVARRFHDALMRHTARVVALPPWPGEVEKQQMKKQQRLF
jgi:uncharacterized protein YecE (DUF72 family)